MEFIELRKLYKSIRGKVRADRYEMINPLVQSVSDMALLTCNLNSYSGQNLSKWNCTEVYRKNKDGKWRIIHSNFSPTK